MRGNAIILNTIANTLNAGGSALVTVFDAGTSAFNCTMSALSPGEKSKMRSRINAAEKKIQALHLEIAKEASKCSDPSQALESEPVKKLLEDIRELNAAIETMKQQILELDTCKPEKKKPAPVEKKPAPIEKKTVQPTVGVADFFIKSISSSLADMLPWKKPGFESKISEHEKKIQALHLEIAKETAKYEDPTAAIGTEPVLAIVAKINQHKAEIAAIRQEIADAAEAKKGKIKPAAVKQVEKPEAAAPVPDVSAPVPLPETVTAAPADPISSVRVASYSAEPPASEDEGIGYTRTKPCIAPTPTLVPPTMEDVQTETREERIRRILEAHDSPAVEAAPVAPVAAEEPTDDEATIEIDPVELETEELEELAAEVQTVAAPVETATVEEPTDDEATIEIDPVELETEELAELAAEVLPVAVPAQTAAVEEPTDDEATIEIDPVELEAEELEELAATEPAAEKVVAFHCDIEPEEDFVSESEDSPVQEDPVSESLTVLEERVEEILTTSELPVPEDEKKKQALMPKPEWEKTSWVNSVADTDDFARVRTKVHAASFSPGSSPLPEFPVPDARQDRLSVDNSGPVFSTRVHHNTVSKDAAETAAAAPSAAFAPFRSAVSSIDRIIAARGVDEPAAKVEIAPAPPKKPIVPKTGTGGKKVIPPPAKKVTGPAKGMSGSGKSVPAPAKSVPASPLKKGVGKKQALPKSEPVAAGGKKGNTPVKKRK